MKVLFIDTAHPYLWNTLTARGYTCLYDEGINENNIDVFISEAEGIVIRSKIKLTAAVLAKSPKLKFIARVGAGMENIDYKFALQNGITCFNAPEGNRNAVAEQALGMLLSLFNKLNKADHEVRNGIWLREENRGEELCGKTVALIGYGNTGSTFAKRLRGFDIQLLVHDPNIQDFGDDFVLESSMDAIFEKADVVSLHVPLTEETMFMVNKQFIQKFKKPIYIINTSRGKCLNTQDLVDAMKTGKVKGACLDVLEFEGVSFEKMEENSPAFQYLIEQQNVILTPHIAGWTHQSNLKMAEILVEKITQNFPL
jgi:D-3-phosphoglycerate dehydrogenase / 2-oxoglutarate reductase